MSTAPAALIAMMILSAAGLLPALALIGLRWIAIPLVPLTGAVAAAMAATGYLAVGGTFMVWFVGLAVVGVLVVVAYWVTRPERRPWARPARSQTPLVGWHRITGIAGAAAILASCAWCLRDLASPTVGYDARALWLTRAGWFLQSHHQLLIDMRDWYLVVGQSAYPPLLSASTAVSWSVTGNHSMRLGVVVIALLNTCALATAAFALVECGRRLATRLSTEGAPKAANPGRAPAAGSSSLNAGRSWVVVPMVVGVVSAVLLIFIAFGITEPFMTNGYADPLWSLAAVGAVAYGLQMHAGRSELGVVLVLVLVAGLSKDEGVATAGALIVLMAIRGLMTMSAGTRRALWWRPVLIGAVELATIGAWPILMRLIHARGQTSSFSPPGTMVSRAHATADGMAPYLHVLVLAAPVAAVGGLLLSRARRRGGVANDWWGWAGLACGLLAVGGALVVGPAAIGPWLVTTVHRVTEFPALTGWWILATWAVVGAAQAITRLERTIRPLDGAGAVPTGAASVGLAPPPGTEEGRSADGDASPVPSPHIPETQ